MDRYPSARAARKTSFPPKIVDAHSTRPPPTKKATPKLGGNRGAKTEKADESTVTKIVTDGKRESSVQLIRRLTREFRPLNVAALAAPYLARNPFDSRGLVMTVTRRWRELPFSFKPSKPLRLTLARKQRGL